MPDRLVAIRKLLTHERQDRRCAAAIVLAELRINDSRSIRALIDALDDEDPLVKRYAIEALGQVDSIKAVGKYVKLMDDADEEVRAAAEAALLHLGEDAVPSLQRLMEGPTAVRRKAAAVLSQLRSAAGLESLIDAVDGVDSNLLDRVRQALRGRIADLPPQDQRALRKRIEGRLNEARRNDDHGLAAALLQLLGDTADETVVTRIMQEIGPDAPAPVRRVAIGALMTALPLSSGRRREAAIERLLDCLGEADEEGGVARPALFVLKDVDIPERLTPKLQGLLEAPSAEVRAYVLSQLGRLAAPESIDTLVDQLVKGSPPVRAAARASLERISAAAVPLARLLPTVEDPARQQEVGELLRVHRDALPPEEAARVCAVVLDRLEDGVGGTRTLIETLSRALPEPLMSEARYRADRLRRRGNLDRAYSLLSAIKESAAFGEEERYQLALLGLLSYPRLRRPLRVSDTICAPFADLLHAGFPLESRLRQEEVVHIDDLYSLGFAFIESRDDEEHDFGYELLEEVVTRDPEGKSGTRARNKLKITSR